MGKSDSNNPSSGNSLGTDYVSYPMFKGLQRPLEFMGVQGRYIYWAAGTAGGGVIGFILGYCIFGFLVGLALLVAIHGVAHQEDGQGNLHLCRLEKALETV